jgi:pyridoxine 5-phosphate synthase
MISLGVNVDHVATIRQARGCAYPDPVAAALEAIAGGADQITIHLREDRRHIQDRDVERMREGIGVPLNLEMAAVDEIVAIACGVRPVTATLVPERRRELTTEGGLDVAGSPPRIRDVVARLARADVAASLFIDPEISQVEAAREVGAPVVELHTGAYCEALDDRSAAAELERLMEAAVRADALGLKVCAGHGINYDNASRIARALPQVVEYNIGHAIVARSLFVGMEDAVREMKGLLNG